MVKEVFDEGVNESRTSGGQEDNSGAWIIGIIVLVAIGIGVWWWAGWGGASQTHTAQKTHCEFFPGKNGVFLVKGCTRTDFDQASALDEFIDKHPDRRVISIASNQWGGLLLITEPKQ